MIRYYITDLHSLSPGVQLLDVIARNLADGVDWIQIREKGLEARELLDLVRRAIALGGKIIVNGRMDVALAGGAAGLHLPAGSIAPRSWRAIAPAGFLIGVSCHTVDEVHIAENEGADYALFGPVFAPLSKTSDLTPRGLDGLAEAAHAVRIPVLAVGGITRENAPACAASGAAGVAGISLFQRA